MGTCALRNAFQLKPMTEKEAQKMISGGKYVALPEYVHK